MYEKFCDTYYLTSGLGRSLASIMITANPCKVPNFELESYNVVRKNNQDFVVDNCGGFVKIEDLSKYNITYN